MESLFFISRVFEQICYTRDLKCTILYNPGPTIYNSGIFSDNLAIFSDILRFFYRISLSIVPILEKCRFYIMCVTDLPFLLSPITTTTPRSTLTDRTHHTRSFVMQPKGRKLEPETQTAFSIDRRGALRSGDYSPAAEYATFGTEAAANSTADTAAAN